MALIMVFSACAVVSAKTVNDYNISQPASVAEPVDYHVPPAKEPGTLVRLYLCSKLNSGTVGHIFIYAENLTDEPVKVGLITLQKDQGVSMGAFGLQRSDGWGVYYNTESYRFLKKDYDTIVALCDELDREHLDKLNKFLQNHNHWDFIFNCAYFAVGAWNSCTSDFVLFTSIPTFTRWQIKIKKHTTLTQMYVPPRENVYYVKGNRKNAKIVICSDDSINR